MLLSMALLAEIPVLSLPPVEIREGEFVGKGPQCGAPMRSIGAGRVRVPYFSPRYVPLRYECILYRDVVPTAFVTSRVHFMFGWSEHFIVDFVDCGLSS